MRIKSELEAEILQRLFGLPELNGAAFLFTDVVADEIITHKHLSGTRATSNIKNLAKLFTAGKKTKFDVTLNLTKI